MSYDDAVLGETEIGKLTSKALRALTKASRACLLYDFDNDSVADFLRELDIRLEKALVHGPIELEVGPWKLSREGEVVYREQDREKSLAFRLYRDGVRSITIRPEVSWEEIVRLVGILSVRYTGIRQQEDDIVTMLWKAGFDHVEVEAVDRYTPVDDELTDKDTAKRRHSHVTPEFWEVSSKFEHHTPEHSEIAEISYRQVAEDELAALRQEDDPASLSALCLRLADLLMLTVSVPVDPLDPRLVAPLIGDIRDFLISEKLDKQLLEFFRLVHQTVSNMPKPDAGRTLMRVLADRKAFARMVDAAIEGGQPSTTLVELVGMASVEELGVFLEVLANRWTGPGRDIGRELLSRALGQRMGSLGELALETSGTFSGDLLELMAEHDAEAATDLALALLRRDDRSARLKSLTLLRKLPYRSDVGRELTTQILASDDGEQRRLAAIVLAAKGERRAFPRILRLAQQGAESGAETKEVESYAVALAWLDRDRALGIFREWVRPGERRLKSRITPSKLWPPAITGLAAIRGDDAAELLEWIHSKCEGTLRDRCAKAMVDHRKRFGHESSDS